MAESERLMVKRFVDMRDALATANDCGLDALDGIIAAHVADQVPEEYWTSLVWEVDYPWGESATIGLKWQSPETDFEFNWRLKCAAEQEKKERAELAKLKEKYEGKEP